jgi:hypothetical protein
MAKFAQQELEAIGKSWIKYIKQEAKKDAAKSNYVPRSGAFYESFSFTVDRGVITLYSTYEWLELITNGTRGKYKMPWLTQERGVHVVPICQQDGTMAFRTAPLTVGKAWVHPKIAKHTFINRAYERAVQDHLDALVTRIVDDAATTASKRKR